MLKGSSLMTKVLIGLGGVAVTTAAVVTIVNFTGKAESYRQIDVYEIEGSAQVDRSEVGVMDAYVDMQLQSQDKADTKEDSYMQLKLDDDKYILMDPLTKIELVATGTKEASKTTIELKEGAIINRIDQPLSSASTYEVNTPNATMAVRGTGFRVEYWADKVGADHTLLSVVEGEVECTLKEDDGITLKTVSKLFKAGSEVHMSNSKSADGTGESGSHYDNDEATPQLGDWLVEELEFIGQVYQNPNKHPFISKIEFDGILDEMTIDDDFVALGAATRYKEFDDEVLVADASGEPASTETPAPAEEVKEEAPKEETPQVIEETPEEEPAEEEIQEQHEEEQAPAAVRDNRPEEKPEEVNNEETASEQEENKPEEKQEEKKTEEKKTEEKKTEEKKTEETKTEETKTEENKNNENTTNTETTETTGGGGGGFSGGGSSSGGSSSGSGSSGSGSGSNPPSGPSTITLKFAFDHAYDINNTQNNGQNPQQYATMSYTIGSNISTPTIAPAERGGYWVYEYQYLNEHGEPSLGWFNVRDDGPITPEILQEMGNITTIVFWYFVEN